MFNKYPYTDLQSQNIDWLLNKYAEFEATIKNQNTTITDFKTYVTNYLESIDIEEDVKNYIDDLLNRGVIPSMITGNWLYGKNIVWYGDSWGTVQNNIVDTFNSIYPYSNIDNRCIGGSLMTRSNFPGYEYNSFVQRIKTATDIDSFDYIFIEYGINDWQTDIPILNIENNEYSFNYALEDALKYISVTFPHVKPIVILPPYVHRNFTTSNTYDINRQGHTLSAYVDNAVDICNSLNVEYINLYALSGVNSLNYTSYLKNENDIYVHPFENLAKRVANIIFMGKVNTGKCYDGFGGNMYNSTIRIDSILSSESYYGDSENIINYNKTCAIATKNSRSFVVNSSKLNNMIVRVRGWAQFPAGTTLGIEFFVRNVDSVGVNAIAITNIAKNGYFEFVVKLPRYDYIGPRFITNNAVIKFTGVEVSILNGDSDIYGMPYMPGHGANVSVTSNSYVRIINGIANVDSIELTVNDTINAYSDILTNLPPVTNNMYISAYDVDNDDYVQMYVTSSGAIRCTKTLNANTRIVINAYNSVIV